MEDFILREKITHFDHERIPERIVHARGVGAHGYFQAYEGNERLTKAGFLTDPTIQTPIFVRFQQCKGLVVQPTLFVISAVLPLSFIPKKVTSTW